MSDLESGIRENPVTALLGPRQCGKTTLSRCLEFSGTVHRFDLENPGDRSALENPMLVLQNLSGLVILDEIHRMPELYEVLRVLVDDPLCSCRFLVLGSSSPSVIREVSETLAGRIGFVDMAGFNLSEIGESAWNTLWLRGGFPRSFLAGSDGASLRWRLNFTRTFLERDIPQLGYLIPSGAIRRFWTMLAHYHGQKWNSAEFARSLGTGEKTANRYLEILCGTYMVRTLQPWHLNMKKRQVRTPKVYIRDSGMLHSLLSLEDMRQVLSHVKVGASWESFAMEQILSLTGDRKVWFWGTHTGAEIDLLLDPEGINTGFEFKLSESPRTTKSIRTALDDLSLNHLYIVYPGQKSYKLDTSISALPISDVPETVSMLLSP